MSVVLRNATIRIASNFYFAVHDSIINIRVYHKVKKINIVFNTINYNCRLYDIIQIVYCVLYTVFAVY